MKKNKHGYVPAALLIDRIINEMRDHVEFEKFLCRTIKDNDTTKDFKKKTEEHPNSLYRFHYNSPSVDAHTVSGRNKSANK